MALIAVGGIMVLTGVVRVATESIGISFPAELTSRQLTIGGPNRYVRNPHGPGSCVLSRLILDPAG